MSTVKVVLQPPAPPPPSVIVWIESDDDAAPADEADASPEPEPEPEPASDPFVPSTLKTAGPFDWLKRKKKRTPLPRTDSNRPIPQQAWDDRGWVTFMMGDPVEFSSEDNSGRVHAVQDRRYNPLDPGDVTVRDGATGTVTSIGDQLIGVNVPLEERQIDSSLPERKQERLSSGPLIFRKVDLVNLKLENERKWARWSDDKTQWLDDVEDFDPFQDDAVLDEDDEEDPLFDDRYELGTGPQEDPTAVDSFALSEYEEAKAKGKKPLPVGEALPPTGLIDPTSDAAAAEFGNPEVMLGDKSDIEIKPQTIDVRYAEISGLRNNMYPTRASEPAQQAYFENVKNNIRSVMEKATPDLIANYRTWYDDAHNIAKTMAQKHGVSLTTVVGVISTVSPNTPWLQNLKMADQILSNPDAYDEAIQRRNRLLRPFNERIRILEEAQKDIKKFPDNPKGQALVEQKKELQKQKAKEKNPKKKIRLDAQIDKLNSKINGLLDKDPAMVANKAEIARIKETARERVYRYTKVIGGPKNRDHFVKAIEIINGEAVATGPKVGVFNQSIIDPESMRDKPTVDGHMINLARNTKDPLNKMSKNLTETERGLIEQAFRNVADEYSAENPGMPGGPISAQELHAVSWIIWRSALENDGYDTGETDSSEDDEEQKAFETAESEEAAKPNKRPPLGDDNLPPEWGEESTEWFSDEDMFGDAMANPVVLKRTNPFVPSRKVEPGDSRPQWNPLPGLDYPIDWNEDDVEDDEDEVRA